VEPFLTDLRFVGGGGEEGRHWDELDAVEVGCEDDAR
jgi:hypothetical protein